MENGFYDDDDDDEDFEELLNGYFIKSQLNGFFKDFFVMLR